MVLNFILYEICNIILSTCSRKITVHHISDNFIYMFSKDYSTSYIGMYCTSQVHGLSAFTLKVICNEKEGGARKVANIRKFPNFISRIFFLFPAHCLITQDDSVRQWAMRVIKERKKTMDLIAAFCLFMWTSPIDFALLGGTGNRLNSKTTANEKKRNKLDRHGPRPIRNVCHLPGPPSFSLQTTFKETVLRDRPCVS
jgi:hypothetical protein